jgi:hypothetical protein
MSESFPAQFTQENDEFWDGVLVPLGKVSLGSNLNRFLTLSPSLVNDDIIQKRKILQEIFTKNVEYYTAVDPLINGSGNGFQTLSSEWQTHFSNLYNDTKHNSELLKMRIGVNEDTVSDCWFHPQQCQVIFDTIFPLIHKINYADQKDGKWNPLRNTRYWFSKFPDIPELASKKCPAYAQYDQRINACSVSTDYSPWPSGNLLCNNWVGANNLCYLAAIYTSQKIVSIENWDGPIGIVMDTPNLANQCPDKTTKTHENSRGGHWSDQIWCKFDDETLYKNFSSIFPSGYLLWGYISDDAIKTLKETTFYTGENDSHLKIKRRRALNCPNGWAWSGDNECSSGYDIGINSSYGYYLRADQPYFYDRWVY